MLTNLPWVLVFCFPYHSLKPRSSHRNYNQRRSCFLAPGSVSIPKPGIVGRIQFRIIGRRWQFGQLQFWKSTHEVLLMFPPPPLLLPFEYSWQVYSFPFVAWNSCRRRRKSPRELFALISSPLFIPRRILFTFPPFSTLCHHRSLRQENWHMSAASFKDSGCPKVPHY